MLVKAYQWILFDADDTLFHFDALRGLHLTLSSLGKEFIPQHYQDYEVLSRSLWIDYQNGTINLHELQNKRFEPWAKKLQISTTMFSNTFQHAMADICQPLDGAVSLLSSLQGKAKLGIITNGFTESQQIRLERTGLMNHFEWLVISEQVGVAKPHPKIFEHAFSLMGELNPEQVLMVGDNPDSDIKGGLNAGMHTCWLNVHNKTLPEGIVPHYEVSSLGQLEKLLLD
jgi:5'-nucleotidase